jgi:hypothetical protein
MADLCDAPRCSSSRPRPLHREQSGGVVPRNFVGGMNVVSKFGRLNATWPLARLILDDVRAGLVARGPLRWAVKDRSAAYSEIEAVQELTGPFGSPGVRIRTRTSGTWCFWTTRPQPVIGEIRAHGVPLLEGCPRLPLFYSSGWD